MSAATAEPSAIFVRIYTDHFRSVYAYCRRRVGADRVDDVVAEAFLTAWRKIDEMPTGDETLPWLYGVAHRVLLHQWRGSSRRKRLHQRLVSLGVEPASPPETVIVANEESRMVWEAITGLRETDQEVLRLSLWEELPHGEIAQVLGIRADAVRKRYSRALKNLTKEFNKLETKNVGSALLGKEAGSGH